MIQNKNKDISIILEGRGSFKYEKGVSLEQIAHDFQREGQCQIVGAIVDNKLRELNSVLNEDCYIRLIDSCSPIGSRIYQRSLSFVLMRACVELFPKCRITVEHSLSKGLYCEIHCPCKSAIDENDTKRIEDRMREIIEEDIPLIKKQMPLDEATEIFKKYGQINKVKLMKYRKKPYVNIYECGWFKNYFYGYMVPSTRYLKTFRLKSYHPGLVIQLPRRENKGKIPVFKEQPKLFRIFRETEKWSKILGIDYVASLNDLIVTKREREFICIAEALHEKKVVEIANSITDHIKEKKLILIAGPTSSGKTTFAKRLEIQLRVNGLKPASISLDDYFVNRENTPRDEEGEYDFEALNALNLELFNRDLEGILSGEEVEIPTFDFCLGKSEYKGNMIKITKEQPLILEGIHCLNDQLTKYIPRENKFKIYISALTQLSVDEHNRIPTTDTRLIRRLVRDSKFRSNDADTTLTLWESVRRGEEKNIFPFQEDADVMFNSALFYELSVLKKYVEPLLKQVDTTSPHHPEAKRLLRFLEYFVSLENEEYIPKTSILKEFIGGSIFC
ncbi:MAG TPA: nucleoside kinase [Clostridia bacterium]|nr:nucleoside kinase [Clostridia bacterium]